jgi:hypothetical protein
MKSSLGNKNILVRRVYDYEKMFNLCSGFVFNF